MHTCTHAHMHTCKHAHMHTYTHAHMHTCTHAHIHTYTHTHIHTFTPHIQPHFVVPGTTLPRTPLKRALSQGGPPKLSPPFPRAHVLTGVAPARGRPRPGSDVLLDWRKLEVPFPRRAHRVAKPVLPQPKQLHERSVWVKCGHMSLCPHCEQDAKGSGARGLNRVAPVDRGLRRGNLHRLGQLRLLL